jgi:ankyrin repeat protein/Tol biopolymer transport system component
MIIDKKIIIVFVVLFAFIASALADEIHEAAKEGTLAKVKELLEKDPKLINFKDENGRTPLHWACLGVHKDVAQYLLEKGADVNAKDNNETTAMHSAAAQGHTEVAKLLIKNGAQINAKNYFSQTPLHTAAFNGQRDVTELLVASGAKLETRDDHGRTPLFFNAVWGGNVDVARILIEHGANLNVVNSSGDTPLYWSARMGYKDMVNLFIEKGAGVPAEGHQSKKLMQVAASKGLIKLFTILMDKGVDFNFRNHNDGTLLHSAAAGGSPEIIKLLIDEGMNVNDKDRYQWTPLHYAAANRHKAAIELLLAKGANVNMKIITGKTPLHLALDAGYKDIAELLIAKGADQSPPVIPILKGDYLGQKKPGLEPELFAKGIISSARSQFSCCVFSPDGNEVFWGSLFPVPGSGFSKARLFSMKRENDKWTAPELAPFSSEFGEDVPFYSPDGKKLFFISNRPIEKEDKAGKENMWYLQKENIWYLQKEGKDWSEPKLVGPSVNAININHYGISVDKDYNLYFASRSGGGKGMYDIYRAKFENGQYSKPENLGDPINTESHDFTPFIAPDGSYLIFTRSGGSDGTVVYNLYISFRQEDGSWANPKNMGEKINSKSQDLCPILSPDGNYLFFLSSRSGNDDIYWMDAKIIENLKPKELQ